MKKDTQSEIDIRKIRSISMLKHYFSKMEAAVTANDITEMAYLNHLIEKEKEFLGIKS